MDAYKPVNAKIKIKPVYPVMTHSGAYEGPCRVGKKEDLTPEAEMVRFRRGFDDFCEDLRSRIGPHGEVLEPVMLQWADDFVVPGAQLDALAPEVYEADIVLIGASGLQQMPAVRIAERYAKPMVMMGQVAASDITAYLRARGMEGYCFLDYADLNYFLSLLRVRKALQQTRLLVAMKGNLLTSGVVSGISDLEGLKERLGVGSVLVNSDDILGAMRKLSAEELEEAEQLTDRLLANSEEASMNADDLLPSVKFYVAARQTLERYEANAFTIPCFEVCASQVMEQERVAFCLTHTLLKDEGIPSACEGDINVLMAMAVLMYLSRRSAHMGNVMVHDRAKNIIGVHHDVPGLKMNGFDEPDLPYAVVNFTQGGWGGTIRYDISRDIGRPVTIARFNPQATKLLVASGEVTGCAGYTEVGCSLRYEMKVADADEFYELHQDFGHHFGLVLGDYAESLKDLGKLAGFEVVTV
jgi:L-fucose isomerase-like protein